MYQIREPYNKDNINVPLYETLGKVLALWTIANFGYFLLLPVLGISISYNESPIWIGAYFLFWAIASVWLFWDIFEKWVEFRKRVWIWGVLSISSTSFIWALLYIMAKLPVLQGPSLVPYTDLILATPWYFLPKATEILVQQVLISALTLSFYYRFHNLKETMVGYAITFGGAHVFLFLLSGATSSYATLMTSAAFVSTLIFPRIIIRVRGAFLYNYVIHLTFYICIAFILHAWPPPGYGF